MIGKRLQMVRDSLGLSRRSLAKQADISIHALNQYEQDGSMPSSDVLLRLAWCLGVPMDFLLRPVQIQPEMIRYYNPAITPDNLLKQITIDVINQAECWLMLRQLWVDFPLPLWSKFDLPMITTPDDVEMAVSRLYEHYQLGVSPITNMIAFLESLGVIVITSYVQNTTYPFDGLHVLTDNVPIVAVSGDCTGGHQRLVLAYALGDLCMPVLADDINRHQVCWRFARAFLLPKDSLLAELDNQKTISTKQLSTLGHKYGLPAKAVLQRICELNLNVVDLDNNQVDDGQTMVDDYPSERSELFEQLVHQALDRGMIGKSRAMELLDVCACHLQVKS